MNDYLQKPASKTRLDDMLRRWSGRDTVQGMRVLLAEDDPACQRVTVALLQSMGAIVVTGGVEALKLSPPRTWT